jgi:hypothetical protein
MGEGIDGIVPESIDILVKFNEVNVSRYCLIGGVFTRLTGHGDDGCGRCWMLVDGNSL